MRFSTKNGQRYAVFDHLANPETGQHIEMLVNPKQEESIAEAAALGASFYDVLSSYNQEA